MKNSRLTTTPGFFNQLKRIFVIAEAGSNWRMGTPTRDFQMAKALIDAAVDADADAIKFQTYRADTVYVKNAGDSEYLKENGIESDINEIFKDLEMPYELIGRLAEYARSQKIQFMSTPFSPADFAAVDPHVQIHKVASYEISYEELIRLAAVSGKPLVMSTGASVPADIDWAVDTFFKHGGRDLCLLQCTAKYPAPLDAMNLKVIPWLSQNYGVVSGLSDHSRHPLYSPLAAVALGARVIEKHFTFHNQLPGPDHPFAITAAELKTMVQGIRAIEQTLGTGKKEVLPVEQELALYARRGVQAIAKIKAGDTLKLDENIAILRPGKQKLGLHPQFLNDFAGKTAAREIAMGTGIQQGDWVER